MKLRSKRSKKPNTKTNARPYAKPELVKKPMSENKAPMIKTVKAFCCSFSMVSLPDSRNANTWLTI